MNKEQETIKSIQADLKKQREFLDMKKYIKFKTHWKS